jgi:integrase/recombinase XerD
MTCAAKMRIVAPCDWSMADQQSWAIAVQRNDIFDNPSRLANLSPVQLAKRQSAYGRWLGFVADVLQAADGISGLDYITPNNVTAFIHKLQSLFASYTVAQYVTDLSTVVDTFRPKAFEYLKIAATNMRRAGRRSSDKRPRLRPASELYQLGLDLMHSAENQRSTLQAAALFRDGLMIALLAARPIRLFNLASIDIDKHLTRHGHDYWLTFPARETKTDRHLEFPLPAELSVAVDQYLTTHRPVLAAKSGFWKGGEHSGLWVSARGSKLCADVIYKRICDRTFARFGHSINPHLFRDCAATSVAIEDPDHVGIVAAILGHSTMRTAETYYNQATSLQAARSHQDVIQSLRKQSVGRT